MRIGLRVTQTHVGALTCIADLLIGGGVVASQQARGTEIRDEFCVCPLAAGDMLREQVAKKMALGIEAKKVVDAGGLVHQQITEILARQCGSAEFGPARCGIIPPSEPS
jgi:hypothetical protein